MARRALKLATDQHRDDCPPGLVGTGDQARWEFTDFPGFLELFGWGTRLLRGPEPMVAVLGDLLRSLDEQGVVEAEIFVAVGQMHFAGTDPAPVLQALAAAARDHEERGGCRAWFIADATRQWGVRAVERVLDTALELREHRIVGFGMGGDERVLRAREFRAIYRRAREQGLGISCHAGEALGPDSVLETVEELGVRRVGHGIAAVRDPGLMRQLAEEGVVLEVCPTSNRRTAVWDGNSPHPLFTLLEHGVPCVVDSDDPAFFGCTLRSELAWLEKQGLSAPEIETLCKRSLQCGFPTG